MASVAQGSIRVVTTTAQGSPALAWAGTELLVTNAADFDRQGGEFRVEGIDATFTYSAVTEGASEDDPDVITTTQPAPASLPAPEFRVDIWPLTYDTVAEVVLPGATDDTLQVRTPHALKPLLSDGVREDDRRESVTAELRDSGWVLTDVLGYATPNLADMDQAARDFEQAYSLDRAETAVELGDIRSTATQAKQDAAAASGLASGASRAAADAHNVAVAAQEAVRKSAAIVRIDSSKGVLFKHNEVATVLKVTVHRGDKIVNDLLALQEVFGPGTYLEWQWQRINDATFGTISSADPRIGSGGFTFTLTPADVDTKVVFRCILNGA